MVDSLRTKTFSSEILCKKTKYFEPKAIIGEHFGGRLYLHVSGVNKMLMGKAMVFWSAPYCLCRKRIRRTLLSSKVLNILLQSAVGMAGPVA